MQKINFFDNSYCLEGSRLQVEFGVYDPGNNQPAFTTLERELFQATVLNPNSHPLQFVPIDHNITILRDNGEMGNICDGMIYHDSEFLSFVELKDKMSGWVREAVGQLRTTIKHFEINHNNSTIKRRYAYAVNSRHPRFHCSYKETIQRFRKDTQFNLRFGTIIKVDY